MRIETINRKDDDAEKPDAALAAMASGGDEEFYIPEEANSRLSKGVLILLAVCGAAGGALYFMYWKTSPQTASADTEFVAAEQTIGTFLAGGKQSITAMQTKLDETEQLVEQFHRRPERTQVPVEQLVRDPFVHEAAKEEPDAEPTVDEVALQKEAARAEVAKLSLQSVINGRVPSCWINNKAYTEGDTIAGTQIVVMKVESDSVIVKHGRFGFRLLRK